MILSSRSVQLLPDGWGELEGPVLAEQGAQDVDATSGERDRGLDVSEAFAALLEVVVAVRSFAHHRGRGGEVEHPAQLA